MAWRMYYSLEAAAEKLSKDFNDPYTADDLIHYEAIGLTEVYINCIGQEYYFTRRPYYDWLYDKDEKGEYAEIPEMLLYKGDFIRLEEINARYLEGKKEFLTVNIVDKLAFIGTDEVLEKTIATPSAEQTESKRWGFCYIPYNLLDGLALSEDMRIKREDLDIPDNAIKVGKNDLCIFQDDLIELKEALSERMKIKKPISKRTENKQAEIIAALSAIYTKTDCSKPYEAAETIIQEWERQADKLGKTPTRDTLAKYIKQGIDRLSQ